MGDAGNHRARRLTACFSSSSPRCQSAVDYKDESCDPALTFQPLFWLDPESAQSECDSYDYPDKGVTPCAYRRVCQPRLSTKMVQSKDWNLGRKSRETVDRSVAFHGWSLASRGEECEACMVTLFLRNHYFVVFMWILSTFHPSLRMNSGRNSISGIQCIHSPLFPLGLPFLSTL